MYTTILWATDGSDTAARALPVALDLAERDKAKLVIVHVREVFVGRGGAYPVLADEDELRRTINRQVEDLKRSGVDARFIVRGCTANHAGRTIADIAGEVGADLIVVGTHGYGRVAGLLLGSTTQAIMHEGVCPVLAVPTGAAVREGERELAGSAAK